MYDPIDGKKSAALVRGVDEYNYWEHEPMTEDEIAVKFDALGADVVGAAACKTLRRVIMSLDEADTLDELLGLMTGSG